jgi:phosphopantothenate synthetase
LEVYNDDCINDDKTIHIIEYLTRKSAHLIKKYKNNEKNEELHSIFDDMDALRWQAAKLKLVRKLKR